MSTRALLYRQRMPLSIKWTILYKNHIFMIQQLWTSGFMICLSSNWTLLKSKPTSQTIQLRLTMWSIYGIQSHPLIRLVNPLEFPILWLWLSIRHVMIVWLAYPQLKLIMFTLWVHHLLKNRLDQFSISLHLWQGVHLMWQPIYGMILI